jgi:glycerol-3-phosphate dehydrogenase
MNKPQSYDAVVIGGGIFGCYSALYLSNKGYRVLLLEKESKCFQKASLVNQARLHSGYHYPRSIHTAKQANEHRERFLMDHQQFINNTFTKYYAVSKHLSSTHSLRFEHFCNYLNIKCQKAPSSSMFNTSQMEALYLTEEYSFDTFLLQNLYKQKVDNATNIDTFLSSTVTHVEKDSHNFLISLKNTKEYLIQTPMVINAAYTGINAINQLFQQPAIETVYELTEVCLVHSRQLKNVGLTVLDGRFISIMPFGLSGLLSLTSVQYTPHKISNHPLPTFSCQKNTDKCQPNNISICSYCPAKPKSNVYKMLRQTQQYFKEPLDLTHFSSLFTVKTKLKSSYIDDARPTCIDTTSKSPYYLTLFSGKINSMYEIEHSLQEIIN